MLAKYLTKKKTIFFLMDWIYVNQVKIFMYRFFAGNIYISLLAKVSFTNQQNSRSVPPRCFGGCSSQNMHPKKIHVPFFGNYLIALFPFFFYLSQLINNGYTLCYHTPIPVPFFGNYHIALFPFFFFYLSHTNPTTHSLNARFDPMPSWNNGYTLCYPQ